MSIRMFTRNCISLFYWISQKVTWVCKVLTQR